MQQDRERDTIFALSTGQGAAAIAVIRISGPRAGDALRSLTGRNLPEARKAVVRSIRDPETGEVVDEALVLWFPGPGSFTGEDSAELHVHGSPAVVRRVLGILQGMPGLRLAEAGEFTRRAFENGRLSLHEVEGLADLVKAETEMQRRQALLAARGKGRETFERWREDLIHVLSRLEAAIDFCEEEDIAEQALEGIDAKLEALNAALKKALAEAEGGQRVREGFTVVIAGPRNAGKSSLLNALARRDVAIVSRLAGTTRDVIEVQLDIGGLPVTLVDTAGLSAWPDRDDDGDRNADNEGGTDEPLSHEDIERIGQERAREVLERADLVLWLSAPDVEGIDVPHMDSETIRVLNKADLIDSDAERNRQEWDVVISAKTGTGLRTLEERIGASLRDRFVLEAPSLITRARQKQALEEALARLDQAREDLKAGLLELAAENVRLTVRALERLIGRVDVEDLLDSIFSEFCIGK